MSKNKKEDLEIAEQHIELAEQIIIEEDKISDNKKKKLLKDAAFCLEKAEADLEEYSEN